MQSQSRNNIIRINHTIVSSASSSHILIIIIKNNKQRIICKNNQNQGAIFQAPDHRQLRCPEFSRVGEFIKSSRKRGNKARLGFGGKMKKLRSVSL